MKMLIVYIWTLIQTTSSENVQPISYFHFCFRFFSIPEDISYNYREVKLQFNDASQSILIDILIYFYLKVLTHKLSA